MMMNMPVDMERLPEFRMLVGEVLGLESKVQSPKTAAAVAMLMWVRLWVELAYQAQTTNRPGWLTAAAARLYEQSLEPLFGEDCPPLKILCACGALVNGKGTGEQGGTSNIEHRTSNIERGNGEGDGYYCDRFAKLNAHLAGDHITKESRGAAASAIERNKQRIAAESNQMGMLLPPEIFKKRDGSTMSDTDAQRCMVLIATVDRCLKLPSRQRGKYTEALMMDAGDVPQEGLKDVYVWLSLHREHPMVPKTTEQVLGDYQRVLEMVNVKT